MTDTHEPDPADVEGLDTEAPEAPEVREKRRRLNLSTVQIGASAGAAVTSALAASFFGVAGTLIGAAVGSIVSTVAGAIYTESMRRAAERVRHTQAIVVARVATGGAVPTMRLAAQPAAPGAEKATLQNPAEVEPVPAPAANPRLRRNLALAGMMVAGFVIALGVITLGEALGNRTASGHEGSTTVGKLFEGNSGTQDDTPKQAPTPSPSATPSEEPSPSAEPSTTPEPSVSPSVPPSQAPMVPPTEAPTPSSGTPAQQDGAQPNGTGLQETQPTAPVG